MTSKARVRVARTTETHRRDGQRRYGRHLDAARATCGNTDRDKIGFLFIGQKLDMVKMLYNSFN